MGRSIFTSLELNLPDLSLTTTLPATERSRSSQECHMPPPYVSTPTWRYADLLRFEMGRTLREDHQQIKAANVSNAACPTFKFGLST
jgi:hypothetical protein